jgi:predicted GH43/DUF377 family glycosyl hydrolase
MSLEKPQMVRDTGGNVVQALYPSINVSLNVTNVSSRVAMADPISLVRIAASVDCYMKFGDSTVTATTSDMLFPAGAEIFSVEDPRITHIAALLVGSTPGVLTATKML